MKIDLSVFLNYTKKKQRNNNMANQNTWPHDLMEIFADPIFDKVKIAERKDTDFERLKDTLLKVSIWIKEKGRFPDGNSMSTKEIEIFENLQALKQHADALKEYDAENILK